MIKTVIKRIGNKHLNLYNNGDGYLYFSYDDGVTFESHSVYVNNFRQLPVERWIEIGSEFLKKIL